MNSPSLKFTSLLLLPVLVLSGCTGESSDSNASGIPDDETVILRVGNRFLTGRQLNRKTDRALKAFRTNKKSELSEKESSRLRQQLTRRVLRKTIVNFLLLSAAQDKGITVSDEALERRWQSFKENFGGTQAFEDRMKQSGRTREELRKNLRQNLVLKEYLEGVVTRTEPTEEQLRKFYRENREQFSTSSKSTSPSFEEVRNKVRDAYRIHSQERQLQQHLKGLWDQYEVELQDQSLSKEKFFEELENPASLFSR